MASSSIKNVDELKNELDTALVGVEKIVNEYPEDTALKSILLQMQALKGWIENGERPTQEQKDSLNFGLLASKYLDDIDDALAQKLYNISSYVIYWQ